MKILINKVMFYECVICRRTMPKHKTSVLFYDGIEEVRVCSNCDY